MKSSIVPLNLLRQIRTTLSTAVWTLLFLTFFPSPCPAESPLESLSEPLHHNSVGPVHWCATSDYPAFPLDSAASLVRSGVSRGIWDPNTEPVSVDILVLYSPDAATAHGSEPALREAILGLVAHANRTFTNSLAGVRLNPVFIGRIDPWTEAGNIVTDSVNLAADSRVTALRKDYKADLVYLIVEVDHVGYLGFATMIGRASGNSQRAYSVMRRAVIAGYPRGLEFDSVAFTHETAHMFGAGHDVEHGYPSPFQGLPPVLPYGNGYRFESRGVTYRTAMAYDPGIQLSLFSNPNLTFDGVPLGIPADQPGQADNAQLLNRMAPVIAGYFTARSRIEFAEPELTVSEAAGGVAVTLRRTGDLNTATQIRLGVDKRSTAMPVTDYIPPAQTWVAFGTNQATAEVWIPIVQDADLEGDETIELTLSEVQGDHGIGRNGLCTVTLRDDEPAVVVMPGTRSVRESQGEIQLNVEFTGSLADGATYSVSVVAGVLGDTAGLEDFEVTPEHLTFSATQRRGTVVLRAKPDAVPESDETVRIQIGNSQVALQILDDDRPGSPLPVAAPDGSVSVLVARPEGGVLVAGSFTTVGGVRRTGIVRLLPDGRLDTDFTPPELLTSPIQSVSVPPALINCLLPHSSGRLLAGGFIGLADGKPAGNLVALGPDGRLDSKFQAPRFDGAVGNLVEQGDGKILVTGAFERVGDRSLRGLARLNPDGGLDSDFGANPGLGGVVVLGSATGVLPDGKILVGGMMDQFNGTAIRNLIRLNADGTLDTAFPLLKTGTSAILDCIAVLPDGRAYVGGQFDSIGDRPIQGLARLTAEGALDPTFRPPNPSAEIFSLFPLPNGQLLVGGMFIRIAGKSQRFVALLNEDGSLDTTFDMGGAASDHVWAVSAGADGSLYVGGVLKEFNGFPSPHLARVRLPQIAGAFSQITWESSGRLSASVIGLPGARYTVESSPNLQDWSPTGAILIDQANGRGRVVLPPQTSGTQFFRLQPNSP